MYYEITSRLSGTAREKWRALIEGAGLDIEEGMGRILLVYDGDEIIATGTRDGCVLKLIAVAESHRGEDITASIITELRRDAFEEGYTHLFIYTKPKNRYAFESLFFYPIAETEDVLVMENKEHGISDFLSSLPTVSEKGRNGSIVMNCNPFTLGHRALIERAAFECDRVFVFVLSEDKSDFSFKDRFEMVKLGTEDIKNVTVLTTGPYLISSATFPTYFLKDRDRKDRVACDVDIKIFSQYFAPRLSITRRYVGTEPNSHLTAEYNAMLKKKLPSAGIEVCVVDRICDGINPISASNVRECIKRRDVHALMRLVPQTTLDYLRENGFI